MLRAFADRMLLKATEMDDPKDLPGVEKAVRVAAIIVATQCMIDAQAAKEADELSEPQFDTIEDAVNDWLKTKPPPA